MQRDELLKAIRYTSGALATKDDVPALASYFFDGESVKAYDDEVMISVPLDTGDLRGGVLGKAFQAWLGACGAVDVECSFTDEEKTQVVFHCGRSRFSLGLLKERLFVFKAPPVREGILLIAPLALLEAIDLCSGYMGTDTSRPAHLGITLNVTTEGNATVYATNNVAIVTATCPFEAEHVVQVVIPNRFITLLLSLSKNESLAALRIGDGWIEATFDSEIILFSRTISDVKVDEFERTVKNVRGALPDAVEIPEGFREMFARAGKVQSAIADPSGVRLSIESGVMHVGTGETTGFALLADSVSCDKSHPTVAVNIHPNLLLPLLDSVGLIAVSSAAVGVFGESFTGLVATIRTK